MENTPIICKPTLDALVRFSIVSIAFLGFGLYFFYDGTVGYRKANEAIYSYHAFARLGAEAAAQAKDRGEAALLQDDWKNRLTGRPLIESHLHHGEPVVEVEGHLFPVPAGSESLRSCPPEVLDLAAISSSWNDCWLAYSKRMRFPVTPDDHPHELADLREQMYAGTACMVGVAVLLYFLVRTSRRCMKLQGDQVTMAGRTFRLSDIECIDLRQWGPGFKGAACLTVAGKKIKADGLAYGGFSQKNGAPAERFMQALLARYQGTVIEYAKPQKQAD